METRQVREALSGETAQQVKAGAREFAARTGTPVLIGYALLLLGVTFLSAGEFHYSLIDRSVSFTAFEFIGFSGLLQVLTLLALASVAVPFFYKGRLAWLAYAFPAFTFFFIAPVLMAIAGSNAEQYWLSRFGIDGGLMPLEPDSGETAFGLYVGIGAALFLAAVGLRNFVTRLPVQQ